ncbi:uncharacterized protein [Haliotis cracherodii]|uniref:uncharacterized protein n=1 Tax=Haliotis cracherodii TaxID=6455 RepID=UPI0039EA16A9
MEEIKLPTKAPGSLRNKTLGRLTGTKQPQGAGKRQTWHGPRPPTPAPAPVPKPNLTWEPGMFNLDYIIRNLYLPRVVICDHSFCDLGRGTMGFDCGQLLMLQSKKDGLKVAASSLAVDSRDGKTLLETENSLLIPEDYKGWFAVLGSELTLKAIPHYRQVGQLAMSDCHTFLIGGTRNVQSVQKVGDTVTASRHLCPGDVLKMGVLDGAEKYLHCVDDNDREVLLSVNTEGTFYVCTNKTRPNNTPVMQIKDILLKQKFPCVVKLVYGREPSGEGVFTKIMVLENVQEDTSILSSTLLKPSNTLHELSVDIPNKFRVAVQSKELCQNPGYISALNLFQDKGDMFMRGIKMFRQAESPIEEKITAIGISFVSPAVNSVPIPNNTKPSTMTDRTPSRQAVEIMSGPTTPVKQAELKQGNALTVSDGKRVQESTDGKSQEKLQSASMSKVSPQPQLKINANSRRSSIDNRPRMPEPTTPQESKVGVANAINGSRKGSVDSDRPKMTEANVGSRPQQNGVKRNDTPTSLPSEVPKMSSVDVKIEPPVPTVDSHKAETKKPRPPRPNAYEEVWTATSGKDDDSSSTSSMSDTHVFLDQGIGGQVVTGGVPATIQTNDLKPEEIHVAESKVDKKQARKLASHYSTINIVGGDPEIVENRQPTTPIEDPKVLKRKKVSFSDILDVHSFTKPHVTTINVKEKKSTTIDELHDFSDGFDSMYIPDFDPPDDTFDSGSSLSSGSASGSSSDGAGGVLESFMADSSSSEDDSGYMKPVLDRKGRVKLEKDIHKAQAGPPSTHEGIAKRISLPSMKIVGSGDDPEGEGKSRFSAGESDILW